MHQGQNSLGLDPQQDQQDQKGLKNQFQNLLPMDWNHLKQKKLINSWFKTLYLRVSIQIFTKNIPILRHFFVIIRIVSISFYKKSTKFLLFVLLSRDYFLLTHFKTIKTFFLMTSNYTFIYDGECPFCNHFAELLEIRSKITNIKILDGRKNLTLIKSFLDKGYDLDKGAILLKDEDIFHGADAINTICKQINNPSSSLLLLLSRVFKSNKRTNLIFPLLVRARRFALISKGISISLV